MEKIIYNKPEELFEGFENSEISDLTLDDFEVIKDFWQGDVIFNFSTDEFKNYLNQKHSERLN